MSTTQTQVLTNGDQKSQFISHLKSYPVVSDGIDTFSSNPYGAKSIEIAGATYERVGKPLEPHLRTPYSYAKPYVGKADDLADRALNTIDSHFPIVKEDTNTIFDTVRSYAFWPFQVAGEGRDYLINAWNEEYTRTVNHNNRGPGVVSFGMAVFSTELRVASDTFQFAADYLNPKKEDLKSKADGFAAAANDFANAAMKQKETYAAKAQQAQQQAAKSE